MKRRWTRELADFLRFCELERRLAPTTCSAYERDISACLAYLQGEGIRELGEVKVTHLRAFLADEQKHRPAVSSQARTTAALKCFFRFLVEEERLDRDPASLPRSITGPTTICPQPPLYLVPRTR
jgi:integrase/recombinase XerD